METGTPALRQMLGKVTMTHLTPKPTALNSSDFNRALNRMGETQILAPKFLAQDS